MKWTMVLLALAAFTGDTARVKKTKSNDAVIQQDAQAANQKVDADKESTQHQQQQKDEATAAAAGERTEKVECTANVSLKITKDPCSNKRPEAEWPECCKKGWIQTLGSSIALPNLLSVALGTQDSSHKCRSDDYHDKVTVTSDMLNRKDAAGNFIPFEVGRMVKQGGCDFKYSLVCGNNKGYPTYPTLLKQIAPCKQQCQDPKTSEAWDSDVLDAREALDSLSNHGIDCAPIVSTPEKLYGDKDFQKCPQETCSKPEHEKSEFEFGSRNGWILPGITGSSYTKIDMEKDEGFFKINSAEETISKPFYYYVWSLMSADHMVSVEFTAKEN